MCINASVAGTDKREVTEMEIYEVKTECSKCHNIKLYSSLKKYEGDYILLLPFPCKQCRDKVLKEMGGFNITMDY